MAIKKFIFNVPTLTSKNKTQQIKYKSTFKSTKIKPTMSTNQLQQNYTIKYSPLKIKFNKHKTPRYTSKHANTKTISLIKLYKTKKY